MSKMSPTVLSEASRSLMLWSWCMKHQKNAVIVEGEGVVELPFWIRKVGS